VGCQPASQPAVLAFWLYRIAIDLAVVSQHPPPPNLAVATVPLPLDLTVALANHSSYWLSLYNLLGTRRLFLGPCSILAGTVDTGGCT
jgi:hypothetical protein